MEYVPIKDSVQLRSESLLLCAELVTKCQNVLHEGKEDWADELADQSHLYLLVYFFGALYIEH